MKTVALFCCALASAMADFVPASEEGNTFKKVETEEAEREGKAFRSVSGDSVLISEGSGHIVVAPGLGGGLGGGFVGGLGGGLGGAVIGSVAGPVALASGPIGAIAVARSCRTEFVTELVTQVCEDTVRNVCVTEHAEVCEERVATRTEQECGEQVVSEPVEHCHPGHGHEVCEETHHVAHHQECTTSYTTECHGGYSGGYRGKRSPTFNRRAKERRKEEKERRKEQEKQKEQKDKNRNYNRGPSRPRCQQVPQQHCHSVPVSTPSRHCHHVASPPVCTVSHVERRVAHCTPVQVHHPETICRTVPNQVCHQEPAQACRKVRPQPQQRTQEVCK